MLWRLVAASAILATPAFAQSAPPTAENEVVVTAPLEGNRAEALQGVAVLDRLELVEQLNGGLGETVAQLPGVASTYFGAGASRPVIRGLGEDRVRILQNGIGAIDASSASPDHAATSDGLEAERIEVLRGPAALAYGGNAIGGVVNVIDQSIATRAPDGGHDVDGLLAWSSGDEGRMGDLRAIYDGGVAIVTLQASRKETENFAIPGFARSAALRAADPLPPGATDAQDEAPNSFTAMTTYGGGVSIVRDWGFAGVALKRLDSEYGLPPEDAGALIGGRIELEQSRIETRGELRSHGGLITRLDWGVQYSDYAHREIEDTGEIATTFTNTGYEARIEAHHGGLDGALDGAFGLQLSDSDFAGVGEEAFITATSTNDVGLFVIERLDNGGWGIEGGGRLERRNLDNEVFGERTINSGSASLGAFLRPADGWFLGATLARTERAPTQVELFAEGPHLATASYERGDPALDKETALSFEASLRYVAQGLRFEANAFVADHADYIALVDSGLVFVKSSETIEDPLLVAPGEDVLPVFDYRARDARFVGGEISLSTPLFSTGAIDVRGDVAADFVRAEFDGGGALPRIPPRSVTVGLEADYGPATARLEVVDVARQSRVDTFESPTDGYTLVNARLAFGPLDSLAGSRIIIDGRNLTDEEAREHISFLKDELPRPGRSVRVALTASF